MAPSQPNVITEPARENTVMTLRVPNLSERKLGRRRPKVAVA
jgi:hypothetical protein